MNRLNRKLEPLGLFHVHQNGNEPKQGHTVLSGGFRSECLAFLVSGIPDPLQELCPPQSTAQTKRPKKSQSQNITIAEKSLRFQIARCKNASFASVIAENRQKIEQKKGKRSQRFFGARKKIAAFPHFQNRCVFRTLSAQRLAEAIQTRRDDFS